MLVLVVDDEESLCELLAEVLAGDYEVIKAFNGKVAYDIAKEKKPDMIISDVMMPHMSGVELLKALRGDPETEHIPVILLSAAPLKAKGVQASAFLTKPFEIEVLEKVVAEVAQETGQGSEDISGEASSEPGMRNQAASPLGLPELQPSPVSYWNSNKS
jgi:CheY-like chemotaxis protein